MTVPPFDPEPCMTCGKIPTVKTSSGYLCQEHWYDLLAKQPLNPNQKGLQALATWLAAGVGIALGLGLGLLVVVAWLVSRVLK